MKIRIFLQLFSGLEDSFSATILVMDNGLPESVGELEAWNEFYTIIAKYCDILRTGDKVELSPVAAYELKRVRVILHKIEMKLARVAKKGAT